MYFMKALLRTAFVFAVTAFIVANPALTQENREPERLELAGIPLEFQETPLSAAVGRLATDIKTGFVLFGIEVITNHGQEPTISTRVSAEATLGEALNQILGKRSGKTSGPTSKRSAVS
jgi:hypothetical protein